MKNILPLILLLILSHTLAAQDCIYLAYESFDTPEQVLGNSHSGQTFKTAWQVQNEDETAEGFRIETTEPLSYGNVQTEGNYVIGGYEFLTSGRQLNLSPSTFFGPYLNENELIGANGTDLWVSVLLRKEEANDQAVAFNLHNSAVPWCDGCASSVIGVGYFGTASNDNGNRFWSLSINGEVYQSDEAVTINETALLAMHITFGAETTVDFFVNPIETGLQSSDPNFSTSTNTLVEFQSLSLFLGNDLDNGSADEIRIGTSWACVTPDSDVSVNLPPTAVIELAPNAVGTAPFTVSHNGDNSTDNDGFLFEYEWILPDGTGSNDINYLNTYTAPGEFEVTLRVTDNHGAQNTAHETLTVFDENGNFPCLSSLTLLQKANCETQTGGSLRVNTPLDVNLTLQDADNNFFSTTSWQQYDNLAPGSYTLLVEGDNACLNEYDLVIPVDSSSCTGWEARACFEQFGMNLTGFADWEKERPMRNLFKHIRRSIPTFTDNCNCWDLNIDNHLALDENGYPTHIPQDVTVPQEDGSEIIYDDVKIRLVLSANVQGAEAGNLQPERSYVLLYDGVVDMSLFGVAQIVSQENGRIEFITPAIPTLDNVIIDVHGSQEGNHLRNIRLLRLEDEFTNLEATPFYDGFLEKIEPFTSLRFMDWGSTNGNPVQFWEDRTPIDFRTYGIEEGAPYEMMIELANTTQKDVWICVPHAADSNYIQQMARLFRDELDENLTIYLEYSNEVWNWIFPQAHYNLETAPSNLNYARAYAEKAKTTFSLWHEEFGEQRDRVQRVLGLQLTYNWLNEQIMSHLDQDDWDYGSPTWYFGLNDHPDLNGETTPEEIIDIAREIFYASLEERRQDYRNIQVFGKGIIEYEGGQHFPNLQTTPWSEAIMAAQELPEIYDLYHEVLDTLLTWGSEMPMAFSLSREVNNIYNFGHMDDIDTPEPYIETAPKYQALLENICVPITSTEDFDNAYGINDDDLVAFPNPVRCGEQLFTGTEWEVVAVEIYNLSGQKIWASDISEHGGHSHFRIGANWPAGIYTMRFVNKTGRKVSRKVVVIE